VLYDAFTQQFLNLVLNLIFHKWREPVRYNIDWLCSNYQGNAMVTYLLGETPFVPGKGQQMCVKAVVQVQGYVTEQSISEVYHH
jgi:hypothetical protein